MLGPYTWPFIRVHTPGVPLGAVKLPLLEFRFLSFKYIDSGLGFGLFMRLPKALEPPQSTGLLV